MVLKVGIFISGRGSNMQALISKCDPAIVKPVVIFSDKEHAAGLEIARQHNIPTETLSPKKFTDRKSFEHEVIALLGKYNMDLLCLAGFMRILSPYFIKNWSTPILNMHPSLLPKYKGLRPQQQALDAKEMESGCSVHLVTEELDGGRVLGQKKVPILDNDTEDSLSQRILLEEHILYPCIVNDIAKAVKNGKTLRSALEFL